jgi:N4-gp56 family major capsid protein
MAFDYDTGVGYAQTTTNQGTRKAWDTLLHEQVQNLLFFKGLIGTDKGGEGALDSRTINSPIVEKTQLEKESGDQITLQLVKGIDSGATWYNDGKTGNTQLVDNESTLTFHNAKVKLSHFRCAVAIDGMMTEQRSPFDLKMSAKDAVAQKLAMQLDKGTFWAYYAKYPNNVMRDLGTTAAAPVLHPNIIYGKHTSLATMDPTDTLSTDLLELVRVFVSEGNVNGIMNEGNTHHILVVHPRNGKTLRADSFWVDANSQAMERGVANPLFQNSTGQWGGIVVKESNNVATLVDFAGITASADVLTVPDLTPPTGVAADFRQCILIGANSVARAYGKRSYMAQRKEDDYGNISGFAGGFIQGDVRADWAANADNGTDGSVKNQSSALLYTYAPATVVPTIW